MKIFDNFFLLKADLQRFLFFIFNQNKSQYNKTDTLLIHVFLR